MKYYIHTHIYICEQSRKTLRRFTERTSTNLGRSNRVPHVCTKMISGKLGGIACRNIYIMICLTPERRLCFLFDQAASLQDSELSEDVLLEEVLGKSLFPHRQVTVRVSEFEPCTTPRHTELPASPAWTASLLARRSLVPYGNTMASLPALWPPQARTFARRNVR